MSRASKKVVAEYYRTALAGEIEAMKALLDPNIRVIEAESLPYGGVWEGIDAFMTLMTKIFSIWKDCRVEVKQLIADGEWVVALTEMSGVGVESGIPFRMPLSEVYRVMNGKIVEITPYYLDVKVLSDVHHANPS